MAKLCLECFRTDEGGGTVVEYAMIAALVAVVVLLGMQALGISTSSLFQRAVDAWPL
jgi:Flp pilus assembly pilin Flp